MKTTARTKSTSVRGKNYILHIDNPADETRVYCGRGRGSVNRFGGGQEKTQATEESACRCCLARYRKAA